MTTYILFIFADFDDHEDIEFFAMQVLGESPVVNTLKYIIEDNKNIIVIFDSGMDIKTIHDDLIVPLEHDDIKFHFLFEMNGLIGAQIPQKMKDFIFKPSGAEIDVLKLEFEKKEPKKMDLDNLLEKIEKFGVLSLTPEEKKFLDNFEN